MRNVAMILMVVTIVTFAAAQVPPQNPVFEVASVKAHTSERVNLPPITPAPNLFSANNATLETILQLHSKSNSA